MICSSRSAVLPPINELSRAQIPSHRVRGSEFCPVFHPWTLGNESLSPCSGAMGSGIAPCRRWGPARFGIGNALDRERDFMVRKLARGQGRTGRALRSAKRRGSSCSQAHDCAADRMDPGIGNIFVRYVSRCPAQSAGAFAGHLNSLISRNCYATIHHRSNAERII